MVAVMESVLHTAERLGLQVENVDATSTNLVLLLTKGRFWRENTLLTPIVILDQFEELFTLHGPDEQTAIIEQLSDLVARRVPAECEAQIEASAMMPFKLVFSVREDYLGEMELVASKIPTVMHHRFRLTALSPAQAVLSWSTVVVRTTRHRIMQWRNAFLLIRRGRLRHAGYAMGCFPRHRSNSFLSIR